MDREIYLEALRRFGGAAPAPKWIVDEDRRLDKMVLENHVHYHLLRVPCLYTWAFSMPWSFEQKLDCCVDHANRIIAHKIDRITGKYL